MLNTFFAGYTSALRPASEPFGDVGRNAFRAPKISHLTIYSYIHTDRSLPISEIEARADGRVDSRRTCYD